MQPLDPRLVAVRDSLAGAVLRGTGGVSYHLRERLGEGGQGWVFRATWDDPDGVVVIVKVLRPDAIQTDTLERFRREAEVLRLLATQPRPNPHIVRFFDHAVAHVATPISTEPLALPFTVLEYVHGPTLEQVLAEARRGLPLDRVRRVARHVVLALELVHSQKIVHRDLKPSNILLAAEAGTEVAKVTDFGLVKLVDMNLQRTTALAGASLGYAPPEQYEQGNQRVSPRTDVFSLATILFEMLTGHRAFPYKQGENPLLIVTRLLNGPRPSFARVREMISPELSARQDLIDILEAQIARATAADPADRQESVSELWLGVEPVFRALADARRSITPAAPVSSVVGRNVPVSSAASAPPIEPTLASGAAVGSGGRSPVAASGRAMRDTPAITHSQRAQTQTPAPSSEAVSANPSSWRWRVRTRPMRAGQVRAASFTRTGERAIGVGVSGLARWDDGQWTPLSLPPEIDARSARGLRACESGELVIFGERGLAASIAPSGAHEVWQIPDREIIFLGAHRDDDGTTTLVGERPVRQSMKTAPYSTMGALAQITGGKLTLLSDAPKSARLRAATRTRAGVLLACGDWGSLIRLELGVANFVAALCAGHLNAIEPLPDGGAVTVGAGGHALSLTARGSSQLEAVQTTRDLLSLTVTDDGVAWAGAAQSRVLRRSNGSWVRMSGEVGVSASVVAIWADTRCVRAICDDGAVIEGVLA
jgi:serine/threonine-protein kinase